MSSYHDSSFATESLLRNNQYRAKMKLFIVSVMLMIAVYAAFAVLALLTGQWTVLAIIAVEIAAILHYRLILCRKFSLSSMQIRDLSLLAACIAAWLLFGHILALWLGAIVFVVISQLVVLQMRHLAEAGILRYADGTAIA